MPPAPADAQIVAPAGRTLFNRGVLVRNIVRYDAFDEISAPAGSSDETGELERWRNVTAIVWGVAKNVSLTLVTPVVRVQSGAARRQGSGDSTVFARYDFYAKNSPGGSTRIASELGLKLPTGGTFGGGSLDASAGLIYSRIRGPNWFVADLQLTKRNEGDNALQAGDQWRADVAYLRRLHPKDALGIPMVLGVLELSVESQERARRAGQKIHDSGGELVFVSPGVEWILNQRLILEFAMPVRVHSDLNGNQPTPTLSGIVGVRWLF